MEEALIKRTMPNSLESEQSVVGSMIMDRDAILTASEILTKDDFYHQQYGVLFEAIVELYNSGQPVDLVTLQNKLREKDVPPEVASLEYISDLVAAVPVTVKCGILCPASSRTRLCFVRSSRSIRRLKTIAITARRA